MPIDLRKVLILIPTLNPTIELEKYIDELINNNFKDILVVNDGSSENCNEIFKYIKNKKECTILEHKNNEGKGKSLKDGLQDFQK